MVTPFFFYQQILWENPACPFENTVLIRRLHGMCEMTIETAAKNGKRPDVFRSMCWIQFLSTGIIRYGGLFEDLVDALKLFKSQKSTTSQRDHASRIGMKNENTNKQKTRRTQHLKLLKLNMACFLLTKPCRTDAHFVLVGQHCCTYAIPAAFCPHRCSSISRR